MLFLSDLRQLAGFSRNRDLDNGVRRLVTKASEEASLDSDGAAL